METSHVDPGSSWLRVDSSPVVEATSMFSGTSLSAEGGSGRSPGPALSARGGNPLSSIGLGTFLAVFQIRICPQLGLLLVSMWGRYSVTASRRGAGPNHYAPIRSEGSRGSI